MSKKVISIVLSAAMLVAMLCVGVGAVTASADDTYTYYFLAADNFFKPEAGASNSSVGVYWWQPSEVAPWPGIEMTAAPEVGENVFKIEGVSPDTTTVIFNAFVDAGNPADPKLAAVAHQTININTEGYDADCPYDDTVATDNFNNWIYVLDRNDITVNEYSGAQTTGGAWFTLDNYKDNEQYYGSYGFGADTTSDTDAAPAESDADTAAKKYHAGDTVTATVEFGGITCNGEAGKIGAYNYDVNYNADVLKYESCEQKTTGGMPLANGATAGVVKLGNMAATGLDQDFTGAKAPVAVLTFTVTADTDDLGITGACTSLSGMSQDGSATEKLVGVDNPDDPYSHLVVDVTCPHETESDTDTTAPVESDTDTTAPVESDTDTTVKPDTDTTVKPDTDTTKKDTDTAKASDSDKKGTGDNASKTSSTTSGAKGTTSTTGTSTATVQTAGTFAVVSLVVILMAAAAVVLYTRKKTVE